MFTLTKRHIWTSDKKGFTAQSTSMKEDESISGQDVMADFEAVIQTQLSG